LIDEAAMVQMANYLVETFTRTRHCHSYITEVIKNNDSNNYYGLYSKFWLLSKYGSTTELLKILIDTERVWVPHERLGRLVASFLPIFYNSTEETTFRELLNRTLNAGIREAYKFHINLSQDSKMFNDMFNVLKAVNRSRGTGITHAKFLCLLSALRNPTATAAHLMMLRTNHAIALKDAYYKRITKRVTFLASGS
jgi:hypothetical protein